MLHVVIKTTSGTIAGRVQVYFTSPPQYYLGYCSKSRTDFSGDPSVIAMIDKEKVWTLTLNKTLTGDRNVVIRCNDVEVVNVGLSNNTCGNSDWSEHWTQELAQFGFSIYDTASDFHRTGMQIFHF